MTIMTPVEPRVPVHTLSYLIARHGWWRVALALAGASLSPRHRARPARPRRPARIPEPPLSPHLRRDIGLPPLPPGGGVRW